MSPQSQLTASRPVVVVVDDDVAVCGSLKFLLELEGFVVRTYRTGAELLYAGDLSVCSCFVIDQKLPTISGIELIIKLRDQCIGVPAILISGQSTTTLNARGATINIDIVEKPLLGNALLDKIRDACHRSEKDRDIR
jgi:two-component system, LuxR family, response regulator FixJ